MKGGLVITDSIQGNGEFTDLQAASASALLIPVYKMLDSVLRDFSEVEGVTLTDYLQMEVFGGQGNTGAVITNMDNKQQAAILIEDMDRGPEKVKLIGYVPAEAVGVNTGKELNLSAEKLNVISENEEGTELLLGLPEDNGGNTGNDSTINVNSGGQTKTREINIQREGGFGSGAGSSTGSGASGGTVDDYGTGIWYRESQIGINWIENTNNGENSELFRAGTENTAMLNRWLGHNGDEHYLSQKL